MAWPYIAQKFDDGSVAEAAGVLAGDQLIAINGKEVLYFSEYVKTLPSLAGQEIQLSVLRV